MRPDVEEQIMIFGLLIHNAHVAAYRKSPKTLKLTREGVIIQWFESHALAE
jgi:hypothetical protein